MRAMRIVLLGLTAMLLGVTPGMTQAEKQESRNRLSSKAFFDRLANGKEVIFRSEVAPALQPLFDRLAERMGITDGRMTREQFMNYMNRRTAEGRQAARAELTALDARIKELEFEKMKVLTSLAALKQERDSLAARMQAATPGSGPRTTSDEKLDLILQRLEKIEKRLTVIEQGKPVTPGRPVHPSDLPEK